MIVRYDALLGGVASPDTHVVANIDVAPTFAAAAGVSTPTVDGISLMPLLTGTATNWRSEIGIEHFGGKAFDTSGQVPSYCGVRTDRWKYIEYATHEEELYDLWADPYELQSLDKDPAYADVRASLHADMLTLCSPPPPGMTP
jgi:arylsulfatase A-like enzyme